MPNELTLKTGSVTVNGSSESDSILGISTPGTTITTPVPVGTTMIIMFQTTTGGSAMILNLELGVMVDADITGFVPLTAKSAV